MSEWIKDVLMSMAIVIKLSLVVWLCLLYRKWTRRRTVGDHEHQYAEIAGSTSREVIAKHYSILRWKERCRICGKVRRMSDFGNIE